MCCVNIKWLEKRNAASQLEPKNLLLPHTDKEFSSTHVLGVDRSSHFPPEVLPRNSAFVSFSFFFLPGISDCIPKNVPADSCKLVIYYFAKKKGGGDF